MRWKHSLIIAAGILLVGTVASTQTLVGPGTEIKPSSSAPTRVHETNGITWIDSSDSNTLKYTKPLDMGTVSLEGGGGGGGVALSDANTWTASQVVASVALSDGATISTNAALGNSFGVTIAASRTMGAPTNLVSGGRYQWEIIQGGTGSYGITWNSVFKWPGGSAPTLQTAVGAKDLISCYYDGTDLLCAAQSPGENKIVSSGTVAIESNAADTSSAVAVTITANPSWSDPAARFLKFINGTSEILSIMNDGALRSSESIELEAVKASGASNVAVIIDTPTPWTTSGNKHTSWRNNGYEFAFVQDDNNLNRARFMGGLGYDTEIRSKQLVRLATEATHSTVISGESVAIAADVNTGPTWTDPAAYLLRVRTNGTVRFGVNPLGHYQGELQCQISAVPTVASAATIAPTLGIVKVSGTTAIDTITAPSTLPHILRVIPTGNFTWTTSGNIGLAGTAVTGKVIEFIYDGTSYWPSYT